VSCARAEWKRYLQERPDRPQGRQRRQADVLLALADMLDAETGEGHVPVLELAKAAGVSETVAKRAITWARTSGLLERTSRGHRLGDGATVASGWRLLLGEIQPQQVSSPPQQANSAPQQVSSRDQQVSSAKAPESRPAAARTGKRGTPTPPPAGEILRHHDWCRDCGFELDRALADAGMQVHPGCIDPAAGTPIPSTPTATRRPS
jgi:hypothetical protein